MAKRSSATIATTTTSAATTHRKSYLLAVTPVDYSLTEGTNIPAPADTPPRSTTPELAPPPTPGRGPLNSHPTTPVSRSEMQLDQSAPEKENTAPAPATRMTSADGDDANSFRTPASPASAAQQQHGGGRPSGVRKLLSLSNLRSSFSSSRTSLAIPRSSHETHSSTHGQYPYNPSLKRPSSPDMLSPTASSIGQPQTAHTQQQDMPPPRPRPRKGNGNWFRRKSALFLPNSHGDLDAVAEDHAYQPDARESNKRVKAFGLEAEKRSQGPPPPRILEIGTGSLSGGDLGWDEARFRR